MNEGISISFVMAVDVIASTVGKSPLPPGLTTAEAGDWVLTINNSGEVAEHNGHDLEPWGLFAHNKRYLVFGIMSPIGGMIGGMSEAEFIEQMRALGAELPA